MTSLFTTMISSIKFYHVTEITCFRDERISRKSQITIYKSFIRPHLHYGDIINDGAFNILYIKDLKLFNIMRCRLKLVAINSTSKEKLYKELSSDSRKPCLIYKI